MQQIPVLHARGKSLAEAWENSLIELYNNGVRIKTQYDTPSSPLSIDASMTIVVESPLSEPMIHKDMPCGLEDLQEYTMEVCDGIKNHWVRNQNDPSDTKWQYTYNQRLFHYTYYDKTGAEQKMDQIENICQNLSRTPYSRRCQAITWKVWEDNDCYDPACWQSLWARCLEEDNGDLTLNVNVRFRSNDCYKAAQLNMFAIVHLIKRMADRIGYLSNKKVNIGRYVHQADSYHLYGSYLKEFEGRFLKGIRERTFDERTINYCDVKDVMDEAIPSIMEKARLFNSK